MDKELINDLDDTCLSSIFSYLVSISDIISAQNVCTRWERLCRDLWADVNVLRCEPEQRFFISRSGHGAHELADAHEVVDVLKYCGPFIKYFDCLMSDHDFISFACIITAVPVYCENLEIIHIQMPHRTPAFRIRTFLNDCIYLRKLHIINVTHDTENDLSLLHCKNIKLTCFSMAFTKWPLITGDFLEYLPADLKELTLNKCYDNPRNFSFSQLKKFKNLRAFHTIFIEWHEDLMEPQILGEMKTLVKLSLINAFNWPSSFNHIVNLVNLKELILNKNECLEDENVIYIVNSCKQIEVLELSGCIRLTNIAIIGICNALENLKSFAIDHVDTITDAPLLQLPLTLERLSCYKCENVKIQGIINVMKVPRNGNLIITIDHPKDSVALFNGAKEVIAIGTHHVSFYIGHTYTNISVIKSRSEVESFISFRYYQDITRQYIM